MEKVDLSDACPLVVLNNSVCRPVIRVASEGRWVGSDPKKSWRKITNFSRPKGPRSYPTLKLGSKTSKTNLEKAQLFAESVERNFGIESHLIRKSHQDRINKFVEAHSFHFTPLDSIHDSTTDTDDDSDLVADVDPDTPNLHSTN